MRQLTEQSLIDGLDEAASRCPAVARVLGEVGYPALRHRPPGFVTLLRTIVGQQVSVASANAIWTRVAESVQPLTPEALLLQDDDALRACGLSRPKIRYGRALAERCSSGALDLGRLQNLPDEEAAAALVDVPGIGQWTAEVYLLFALGRRDVLPAGDLALLTAAQRLFGPAGETAAGGAAPARRGLAPVARRGGPSAVALFQRDQGGNRQRRACLARNSHHSHGLRRVRTFGPPGAGRRA